MQWRCPQEVEDALWAAARELLPAAALERKRLIRAIEERTALYTSERSQLAATTGQVMPASDLAARALFFTVADCAKIEIPLAELAGRNLLPKGPRWRVLDLGAGAGAMGLGIIGYASVHRPGLELEIQAVDLDSGALEIYRRAVSLLAQGSLAIGPCSVSAQQQGAEQAAIEDQAFDLIVLGSMLNELSPAARTSLCQRALRGLAPGGSLVAIEPALRETSRGLHALRDTLSEAGASIFAPCTRKGACPALLDERDWCHEDRAAVLPSRARQIAQTTGLRDGGLKFSYLVVRDDSSPLVLGSGQQAALRVVSQPRKGKGQRECFVCGAAGRGRLRLLKRNRDSRNRVFDRARRGDVLLVEGSVSQAEGRTDLRKGQGVVLCRPAEIDPAENND